MKKSRLSTSASSIDNRRAKDCQPLTTAQKRRVRAVTMALRGGEFMPGDHFKLVDPSGSALSSFKVGVTGTIVTPFKPEHGAKRYLARFDDKKLNPQNMGDMGELFKGARYYWVREPDIKFIYPEDE